MRLPFEQAAESIGAKHLEETDQDITVVLAYKTHPVDGSIQERLDLVHIKFQQAVLPFIGQFGLGLPQQGGDIVLQGAFHSALVIDEMYIVVPQHNIPALEIAEHKILMIYMRKIIAQRFELIY